MILMTVKIFVMKILRSIYHKNKEQGLKILEKLIVEIDWK